MELFSTDWMQAYRHHWNNTPEVADALARAQFSTTIGVGYPDQDAPAAFVRVENGLIVHAGSYDGTDLDWDMRAHPEQWEKWQDSPPGMVGLGSAVALGRLKLFAGDYATMIKNPALAGPFVKSFGLMPKVRASAAA